MQHLYVCVCCMQQFPLIERRAQKPETSLSYGVFDQSYKKETTCVCTFSVQQYIHLTVTLMLLERRGIKPIRYKIRTQVACVICSIQYDKGHQSFFPQSTYRRVACDVTSNQFFRSHHGCNRHVGSYTSMAVLFIHVIQK